MWRRHDHASPLHEPARSGAERAGAAARLTLCAGVLVASLVGGCSAAGDEDRAAGVEQARQAVIDGSPAPEQTGVVHVAHPDLPVVCSGTVIAPTLVVTAKHCVVREQTDEDAVLSPSGFRVGFGPDLEQLTILEVERTDWIGAPEQVEVAPAVEAGEDVALLHLAEPVVRGTQIHALAQDYEPAVGDSYLLVGYGRSSLETGLAGTRLSSVDEVSAYDPVSGILEATGNGACDGDSGGPFLHGADGALVAVISEIGGSDENTFCDIGVTFGHSLANPRVKQLLSDALASLPPCEQTQEVCDNGQDENCDGQIDEYCGQDGDTCSADTDCETELCRDLGEGLVCVQRCEELNSCRAGYDCWRVAGEEHCVARTSSDGSAGSGAVASAGAAGAESGPPAPAAAKGGCGCRTSAGLALGSNQALYAMAWLCMVIARRRRMRYRDEQPREATQEMGTKP
jgi:hypothetical protein